VFDLVAEPLKIHRRARDPSERRALVYAALERAGLHPAAEISRRYPHHLSGGQRQRVAIAAVMVLQPALVVADEPVSMLDVSLRAGILKLMLELRDRRDLACLFITHDLSLAWVVADRIAVVYLGRIVEIGSAQDVLGNPKHPYTKALVSVIPVPEAGAAAEQILLSARRRPRETFPRDAGSIRGVGGTWNAAPPRLRRTRSVVGRQCARRGVSLPARGGPTCIIDRRRRLLMTIAPKRRSSC